MHGTVLLASSRPPDVLNIERTLAMSVEDRIAELTRDISFLARHMKLREVGHATPREYGRLQEIADRVPRETASISLTSPENRTP